MKNHSSQPVLLSFAIPTYNRSSDLRRLLTVLLDQLQNESRVEVIVSDNASTDNTSAVVQEMRSRGLPLLYLRNEANLGPDANIFRCYQHATGKYVWLFGDDDIIAPHTIRRVLTAVEEREYDLIAIKSYSFTGPYPGHRRFTPRSDVILTRVEDLAWHMHVFVTLLSGFVLNKERADSLPHEPFDSLLNSCFLQLGPLLTVMSHHRRSLLIRDPLVATTANASVPYALYRVFGAHLAAIVRRWLNSESARRSILNSTIRCLFPFWLIAERRKPQAKGDSPLAILNATFAPNPRLWFFAYPCYAFPTPVARLWLFAIRIANKTTRFTGLPW
jgi:glycosyltransferase involved in cell wall biosynthesis